jgi:hypothetical protein
MRIDKDADRLRVSASRRCRAETEGDGDEDVGGECRRETIAPATKADHFYGVADRRHHEREDAFPGGPGNGYAHACLLAETAVGIAVSDRS